MITEGKWWDDSPTITLYHGTSLALRADIETNGLVPPSENLRHYAEQFLEHYVPRDKWTPELLERTVERVLNSRGRDRTRNFGAALYFKTKASKAAGYAKSYAAHGGEIAYEIWHGVVCHSAPEGTLARDLLAQTKIKPRLAEQDGMVVEVEVPKEWCLWHTDLARTKERVMADWERREEPLRKNWFGNQYPNLGAALDTMVRDTEVRITRAIPPEMIRSFRPVGHK